MSSSISGRHQGGGGKPLMGSGLTCLACAAAFSTPAEQKEHYRSDWHRYNLKRKLAELPPISADGFARRLQCALCGAAAAAAAVARAARDVVGVACVCVHGCCCGE